MTNPQMHKRRIIYIILVTLVIIAGLLSRRMAFVPLWVGDTLWALMVYLMVRVVWIKAPVKQVTVVSLLFCFAIECSQLYQAPWINQVRQTLPGKLILGQGFLWGDLLAYTLGIAIGAIAEHTVVKRT
jgi:hypothetical protein